MSDIINTTAYYYYGGYGFRAMLTADTAYDVQV